MESHLCLKPPTSIVLASSTGGREPRCSANSTYQLLMYKKLAYQKKISYWVLNIFLTTASHL